MLTEAQIERYARHVLLREVGGIGQERLLGASVAVEGLEGAGWLVSWLALAGVGKLILRDDAPVGEGEVAPLLARADLGSPRAAAFAAAIPAFNADVRVEVGGAEPCDLRIVRGLPAGDARALHWLAAGDAAWILPREGRFCAACAAAIPAALPTPAAGALAGSVAGGEALIALLGRGAPGRQALVFRGGEPVACPHAEGS